MDKEAQELFSSLIHSLEDSSVIATLDNHQLIDNIRSKNLVVYFYPKDDTPGCTSESQDFAMNYSDFQNMNTDIIGISRDSLESHFKFKKKYNLPFELISDTNSVLCNAFQVVRKINFLSIERSTFLFNSEGELLHAWRKVKVKDHINEVLSQIKSI